MKKITHRPERNFFGRPQRERLALLRAAVAQAEKEIAEEWYCGQCGFVPVSEVKRESETAITGICKCGRKIDDIPF